jgi:hypothetical protein
VWGQNQSSGRTHPSFQFFPVVFFNPHIFLPSPAFHAARYYSSTTQLFFALLLPSPRPSQYFRPLDRFSETFLSAAREKEKKTTLKAPQA